MCIENQSHPFVSHRTLSHRRLSSSSPPPVGRSLADRIADRPIAIPLDPTRDARSTSHAFRDAPDAAPARRYRHGNISPHSSPTSVGVDVAAPSTASAFPSSCPPTRERETVLPTTSHDSINHRGTRVWSPASVRASASRLVRSRASFATHPLRSGGVVHDDESALLRGDPNRLRRDEVGGRESLHHHLSKVSRARVCRCDGRDRTTPSGWAGPGAGHPIPRFAVRDPSILSRSARPTDRSRISGSGLSRSACV